MARLRSVGPWPSPRTSVTAEDKNHVTPRDSACKVPLSTLRRGSASRSRRTSLRALRGAAPARRPVCGAGRQQLGRAHCAIGRSAWDGDFVDPKGTLVGPGRQDDVSNHEVTARGSSGDACKAAARGCAAASLSRGAALRTACCGAAAPAAKEAGPRVRPVSATPNFRTTATDSPPRGLCRSWWDGLFRAIPLDMRGETTRRVGIDC
eukprot:365522-Chlamydomonas_euryale.AAC.5